jgi:hypothetical protein
MTMERLALHESAPLQREAEGTGVPSPSSLLSPDRPCTDATSTAVHHPSQSQLPVVVMVLELAPARPLVVHGGILRGALGLALYQMAPQAYQALYESASPPFRMAWLAPRLKLALFGPATQYATALLQAVDVMGRNGLGHHRVPVRVRAAYQYVAPGHERPLIRDGTWLDLPEPVLLGRLIGPRDPVGAWALHLDTPLLLKHDNRIVRDAPSFAIVAARAIERCSKMLHHAHEFPLWPAEARAAAADVPLLAYTCRWTQFERYSARQKQTMTIGGLRGVLHYGPAPPAALAWVRACTVLGLGGKLSFGLGEVRVSEERASLMEME